MSGDFPKGLMVASLSLNSQGWQNCFCCLDLEIRSLFECLPSPVGALSSAASELLQSGGSTADSKDSFVTTESSKTSKDCPVGFADFASVSVAYLQFFSCKERLCLQYPDLTLQTAELKAPRCQLSVTGPHPANFPTPHSMTSESHHRTAVISFFV